MCHNSDTNDRSLDHHVPVSLPWVFSDLFSSVIISEITNGNETFQKLCLSKIV